MYSPQLKPWTATQPSTAVFTSLKRPRRLKSGSEKRGRLGHLASLCSWAGASIWSITTARSSFVTIRLRRDHHRNRSNSLQVASSAQKIALQQAFMAKKGRKSDYLMECRPTTSAALKPSKRILSITHKITSARRTKSSQQDWQWTITKTSFGT